MLNAQKPSKTKTKKYPRVTVRGLMAGAEGAEHRFKTSKENAFVSYNSKYNEGIVPVLGG
jgi:hypothetical protein